MTGKLIDLWSLTAGCLVAASMVVILVFVPAEETMGAVQRILYVHVPLAWLGLVGFIVMAGTGVGYLVRRDITWDHWSQSAAELGWLCCTLTLVTGSMWASEAWNTWWTWDPRLTTAFVLWLIYSGYLLLRGNFDDMHRRARISAVVAIIGVIDVPLVVMATRWFRGIHPVTPAMEPLMRLALLFSVFSFTAFFALLLVRRRLQVGLEYALASLSQQILTRALQ
jgi:heme exporter protein C